jgi:tetratricopeptide (TPR) repeat protein
MLKKVTLFLFISLLNVSTSFAAYPKTDQDFSLLPPFCWARANGDPGRVWEKRFNAHGGGFLHVHHYCAALHTLRLANNILGNDTHSKMEKSGAYGAVISNIEYMENNVDPSSTLFPHMYTTKAEALFALDRPGEAAAYLTKAIQKNKKFTKAYDLLADYYIKTGNKKSANEILQEGLKYSPKSKKLQKKLNDLSK